MDKISCGFNFADEENFQFRVDLISRSEEFKYSTLSITRILENSNVSKIRTNYPVPWPSHSSLGEKTRISRFLEHFCQSLGLFSLVNSNFHPNI